MYRLLILLAVALPAVASAFMAIETDISQPYEVFPVEVTLPEQISYLGTLEGYPVMYEVISEESFTLTAQIAQPASASLEPFSLLLIRRNDRGGGVTEVARQNVDPSEWRQYRDSLLGLSLVESPILEAEVGPGTYRLEVSSGANQGQFLLSIGSEQQSVGYAEQLGYVRQVQTYFGYGVFNMLRSSLIYYPIGILLLLGAMYQTARFARRRNQTQNAT